jgi:hypothetical protein
MPRIQCLLISTGDRDHSPFSNESFRSRQSNAAISARNQRYLTFQSHSNLPFVPQLNSIAVFAATSFGPKTSAVVYVELQVVRKLSECSHSRLSGIAKAC